MALGVTTLKTALSRRHVEAPVLQATLDFVGLVVQPARHLGKVPGGNGVDELVVHHVTHRRRPVLVLEGPLAREERLVETNGRGLLQAFGVGAHEGLAVTAHGGVDRVPTGVESVGQVRDVLTRADLSHHPLGRSRRQPTTHRGDAVIAAGEGLHGTL